MRPLATPWRAMTPADRLVLLLAWAGALASLAWYFQAPTGRRAEVVVDGRVVANLDLRQERDLTVTGAQGTSHIRVRDGAVRFTHSACRAGRCVRSGWLERGGQTAACVPNQVLVRVRGPGPASGGRRFDALNF